MAQTQIVSPVLNSQVTHDHEPETVQQRTLYATIMQPDPPSPPSENPYPQANIFVPPGTGPSSEGDIAALLERQRVWADEWATYVNDRFAALEGDDKGVSYNFKVKPEILWALGTIVATVLLAAFEDIENVTDWKTWLLGLGAALVRALGGYLLGLQKGSSLPSKEQITS